jgi:hypothetical protein
MQVESSNIASVGHDNEQKVLVIEFKNQSTIYAYHPVTEEAFKEFLTADSKGSYFSQNIKDNKNITFRQIQAKQS